MTWRCLAGLLTVGALIASGCGILDEETEDSLVPLRPPPADTVEQSNDERRVVDPTEPCTQTELQLDESDDSIFVTAHRVVGGSLGPPCLGEGDWNMLAAWNVLASIASDEQLDLISVFAGFVEPDGSTDNATVAYVYTIDDLGWEFQMSVNLDAARDDPDDLAFTIVHEFAHVLTRTPSQMDRLIDPLQCRGYDTLEGCFVEGSYIVEWIEEFWTEWIDDLDPTVEADPYLGEPRCEADPGFLNNYAASDPEEDFAESFAAFVLRVQVPEPVQPRLDFFARYPEFEAVRQRAIAAGLGPLPNTFAGCG